MKKVLFSLLTVLLLASCGGADPVKFNDALAKANNAIATIQGTYHNELDSDIMSQNFSSISARTDSALAKIDVELKTVKDLDVPKGGDAFKEAALKSYEGLRTVVETGKKFATLTKDSSEEDLNKIIKEYEVKVDEYSKLFNELTVAQATYATENNYKVQK